MMMRHLIWKDAQTIRPLVIAIAIGIVGLHLMMLLLFAMTDAGVNDIASGLVSLWILMPNLVALGAPSLLVGGEEESGTLNWLRTLPVSWQKVIDSKFLVAWGAVVATWLAASVVLVIALAATGSLSGDMRDIVTFANVLYLAFFSMLLLSTGFALAYLFRSPVTALIAVIPAIAVLNGLALGVGSWILGGQFRGIRVSPSTSTVQLTTLFAAGTGTLVLLWIVQRLLGRRRMTRREGSVMSRWNSSPTVTAYRPPARAGPVDLRRRSHCCGNRDVRCGGRD